eukprot:CAMPEP_0181120900 /NCGR_PEP_ID=MMETSP1071-20121207/24427_1 /TAXON_ID=35127 /ORGANISM="Thalassiosira sp., Strain NH16" /LENGTH=310 /DNA_ID=CAMNT_0023205635 /DNA_START=1 /DNA_END=933 /DNA_ORIENTATION=-
MKCAKCPRAYCSRACQINDWKTGRHKVWCGKAGENCIDYEIRCAGDKGLGLFTLRDFKRGEKILAERAVATKPQMGQSIDWSQLKNENVRKATMSLAPIESLDLDDKFEVNSAALGDDNENAGTGLFLNFSRVNHDCIGNVAHYYDPDGVKLLVANHDIPAGTEVTFSYACNQSTFERTLRMSLRGFQCTCVACHNLEIAAMLDRMRELDNKIMVLGSQGHTEQAIRVGRSLLKLYDKLQVSDLQYTRAYYDLYQLAITKQKTVNIGIKFIGLGYTHALRFYGREENPEVRRFKHYVDNPSSHRNFRLIN